MGTERSIVGVVLSGGKSRRMGRDKAWIEVDGIPMIQRVLRVLDRLFDRLIVVHQGPPSEQSSFAVAVSSPLKVIHDLVPDAGPLGGVFSALDWVHRELTKPPAEGIFVVACDMPYVRVEPILGMMNRRAGYDVVLPMVGGRRHPLHAFYRLSALDPIREKMKRGDLTIHTLWPGAQLLEIGEGEYRMFDPDLVTLVNINTVEELEHRRSSSV
jgi:molybdopterin-guanine dinucleotide biosynthesis protein A